MKPQFEHVTIPSGCSIRVLHRQIPHIPFEWHHHPECELTLTLNSRGMRFIADHVGAYDSHDLVLVPPEMPHTWASTESIDPARPQVALVIWFKRAWALQLADVVPEYAVIHKLLKKADAGLSFPPSAGRLMEARLEGLVSRSARNRLQNAVDLLVELAGAQAVPLAASQRAHHFPDDEAAQLNRILDFLHERFAEPLRVKDLCSVGNVTERSLHRMFVRHLGENISGYLRRLRIGRACMRLVETGRPVSVIAAECGFTNLAHFNRQFRAVREMTPKEFRRSFAGQGRVPGGDDGLDVTQRSPSLEASKRRRTLAGKSGV